MRPLALLAALAAPAQAAACLTDAMVVFDGSASMAEISMEVTVPRIVEARAAMGRVMPQVEDVRRVGLMTYGPGGASACEGIVLAFPPRAGAAVPMAAALDALEPAGLTPLADAVAAAAALLDYRAVPATIVLVTDGNETCGGRPCALGTRLAAEAADLTIHVVGYRASRDFFAWDNPDQQAYAGDTVAKCLSDRTGGLFVGAETEDALVAALQATLGCPLTGALPHPPEAPWRS